jgi:hypothetical protein
MHYRNFVVDWTLLAESPVGAAVGGIGCGVAVRAPSRAGVGIDRSSSRRDYTLEGLATSCLRADLICSHRCHRRIPLAASDYEANVEGAFVGVDFDSAGLWIPTAVLGRFAGAAAISRDICLSISNDEISSLKSNFSSAHLMGCVLRSGELTLLTAKCLSRYLPGPQYRCSRDRLLPRYLSGLPSYSVDPRHSRYSVYLSYL